ncbi:MAG: DUF5667 domain-containing protein [Patescibacteria group bacterium]
MKKLLIILTALTFLVSGGNILAQDNNLPSPGVAPGNPFYFLDKLGETLQEFFTFNPESKARLQITFAAERIAEIRLILEEKGVEAKGLAVAESGLKRNIAKAAAIVEKEKSRGKDVRLLAKELNDGFEKPKTVLSQTYKDQKEALEAQKDELKAKIREARLAGDTALVESLTKQLDEVKAQKKALEAKEEDQDQDLEEHRDRIEKQIESKDAATEAISEAKDKKAEILRESAKEGIILPTGAFDKFDKLLSQAEELFVKENYQGARQLAKQAKKSLEKVKESAKDLAEAVEKEEDAEDELEDQQKNTEEKLKEATQKEAEKIREDAKQEEEEIREDQKQAAEERKKAEERLREAEKD